MKQINRVKWYKTTEKKPDRDCIVVLRNRAVCFGTFRAICELEYSKKFDSLNYIVGSDRHRIELTDYEYWCYADEFYEQFERAGIHAR